MLNGRLGNQLWEIVATISCAKQENGTARFRPDWEYRRYFSVPDELFEEIPAGEWTLDGGTKYFQDLCYLEGIEELIREYFQPKHFEVFEGDKHRVAVHVRRGDYLKYPTHFPLTTALYYQTATSFVRKQNTIFHVFSDDITWCVANLDYLGLNEKEVIFCSGIPRPVEVENRVGSPVDQDDFFRMTLCNEHIISNSSFAWWAAWLSENSNVIYPSEWFGTSVPGWQNWRNMIPDDWQEFPC